MAEMDLSETPGESERATMDRVLRMFSEDGVAGYGPDAGVGVHCPFCPPMEDSSYIHIGRRVNFLGNDTYDAAGRYGLEVRGDVTAIEFWSETCPHRWALAFGFHKGATFVRVIRLADTEATPPYAGDDPEV